MSIECLSSAVGIVSDLASILALVIAGVWAWKAFVRERIKEPKAHLDLRVSKVDIHEAYWLVRVTILAENVGAVANEFRNMEVRLRCLRPLAANLRERIESGTDPVEGGRCKLRLEGLAIRQWSSGYQMEVEPGERDETYADFIVGKTLEIIEVYAFLKNERKDTDSGWTKTVIFQLTEEDEVKDEQQV